MVIARVNKTMTSHTLTEPYLVRRISCNYGSASFLMLSYQHPRAVIPAAAL